MFLYLCTFCLMVYFNSNNEVLYIVRCDVPYLFAMDLTEMNKKYPVIFDKKKKKKL